MLETKITITRATFARIEASEPPSATLHKILTRPDGKQRYVSISVPIRDERLLARAKRELIRGDEIEVQIETRWAEDGIPKTLLDFSKIAAPEVRDLLAVGQAHV